MIIKWTVRATAIAIVIVARLIWLDPVEDPEPHVQALVYTRDSVIYAKQFRIKVKRMYIDQLPRGVAPDFRWSSPARERVSELAMRTRGARAPSGRAAHAYGSKLSETQERLAGPGDEGWEREDE